MRTLEQLKDAAFEYVLKMGIEGYGGEEIKEFCEECARIRAPYKIGETVWFLRDNEVCKGKIKRVVFDWGNHQKTCLLLQDEAGEEMLHGQYVGEDLVFLTKEKLVEYFKELFGL